MQNNNENKPEKAEKYIPSRMCQACRKRFPKSELLRFVLIQKDTQNGEKNGEKVVVIDDKQTAQSRGMYLCNNAECFKLAEKKNVFKRLFKNANLGFALEEFLPKP